MQIPSLASNTPIGTVTYPEGANPNAGKTTLGAEDFMKLLTTQMTAQDPMEPMKDTEFIAQMASFTSLEQMRDLSASFKSFTADQAMAAAPSYVGRYVTITDPKAGAITGVVDSVIKQDDGTAAVMMNGKPYELKLITTVGAVAPAPAKS